MDNECCVCYEADELVDCDQCCYQTCLTCTYTLLAKSYCGHRCFICPVCRYPITYEGIYMWDALTNGYSIENDEAIYMFCTLRNGHYLKDCRPMNEKGFKIFKDVLEANGILLKRIKKFNMKGMNYDEKDMFKLKISRFFKATCVIELMLKDRLKNHLSTYEPISDAF